MLLAITAALALGMGSAYAGDSSAGLVANTVFTQIPGVAARAPVQNLPSAPMAQDG